MHGMESFMIRVPLFPIPKQYYILARTYSVAIVILSFTLFSYIYTISHAT